jgi:hypothetical protein
VRPVTCSAGEHATVLVVPQCMQQDARPPTFFAAEQLPVQLRAEIGATYVWQSPLVIEGSFGWQLLHCCLFWLCTTNHHLPTPSQLQSESSPAELDVPATVLTQQPQLLPCVSKQQQRQLDRMSLFAHHLRSPPTPPLLSMLLHLSLCAAGAATQRHPMSPVRHQQ